MAGNETAASFTCENNQPLAAIVANGGVGLLRAEIDQRSIVGIWPVSEVAARLIEVRSVGRSGLDVPWAKA